MDNIEDIKQEISSLREKLINHKLYKRMTTEKDIQIFMGIHIFSVWDFMSILKSLQNKLTTTTVPWIPSENRENRRLINEITLCEESDLKNNITMSHFEMYIDAMKQAGASTEDIETLVTYIRNGKSYEDAFNEKINIKHEVKEFVDYTFEIINTQEIHLIAALFTFSRENIIPDMFIEIVNKINESKDVKLDKLVHYLDRHIEVDGDTHGPMALNMIRNLCSNDQKKWSDAKKVVVKSLEKRIKLWDCAYDEIVSYKNKFKLFNDKYYDSKILEELKNNFKNDGYINLNSLFNDSTFNNLHKEMSKLKEHLSRKDFIMEEYSTPRNMSVVGGSKIMENSNYLTSLYMNYELRNLISYITESDIYSVNHPEEFMVMNSLDGTKDTHGWHLDDPEYALIIVFESPLEDNGGEVEFVNDWNSFCKKNSINSKDIDKGIEIAIKDKKVMRKHHEKGDCYLLYASKNMHRVAPLLSSKNKRQILNIAFSTEKNKTYGQSANILYI